MWFSEEDLQKTVKCGTQPGLSKALPPSPTVAAELERRFCKRECENTAWVAAHGRAAGCKGQALRAVRALRPPQARLQSRAGGEGARGPWGGGAEKSLLGFSATLFYPILATRSAGLLPHSHSASHSNRAPRPTPAWHPSTLAVSLLSQDCTFPPAQSSRWGLILTELLGCRGGNDG